MQDKSGKRAAFDIIMISDGLSWQYNGEEMLRDKKPMSGVALHGFLKSRFAVATDIIASGVASAEGHRRPEELRALRRGQILADMASEVASPGVQVWVLNLGQHLVRCEGCTSDGSAHQRPVFLIGVVHKESEDINLIEALRMALARRSDLPKPENYSLFDLRRR